MKSQENEETNYFFFCWIRNDWTLFRQRSQKWIYNCVILFVVSTWVEIFMDRGCFEGHEWFRYLGALHRYVRIHLFAKHIAHQYRYFYWYSITFFFFFINYSSHVSLYFQKCKGKSGTYRSTTIFIEITSRFRITNCLLIDRLINSCKMIIKR